MARRGIFQDGETISQAELQETIEKRAAQLAASGESGITLGEEEDADELRALTEIEGAAEVQFQIWRVLPAADKGFVTDIPSAELTVKKVQEIAGPGRYRIRGIRSNGTYAGQRTIDIAPMRKPEILAAAPQTAPSSSMSEFMQMMELQNERRRQEDKERQQTMLQWGAILAPVLGPIVANMFGAKGPTLAELTTTLTNMKALNGGEQNALSQVKDLAGIIAAVKDISGDGGGSGSNWVDLVRDGVKELAPAVTAFASARMGASQPAPAPGIPQIGQENIPQQTQGDPMLQLMGWLKTQLQALTHQAAKNGDPNLYADVVLDNLPPGVDPKMLRDMLARNDWWQQLSAFDAAVKPYPAWFAECRQALVSGLNEIMQAVEPPAPKAPRNVPVQMPSDTDVSDE